MLFYMRILHIPQALKIHLLLFEYVPMLHGSLTDSSTAHAYHKLLHKEAYTHYALYGMMSSPQNIAFPLQVRFSCHQQEEDSLAIAVVVRYLS